MGAFSFIMNGCVSKKKSSKRNFHAITKYVGNKKVEKETDEDGCATFPSSVPI
jgi:hypothetical protein